MNANAWTIKAFLVVVVASILAVQADIGGNPGRAGPAQVTVDPAKGALKKEKGKDVLQSIVTPEERDRRYQDMLKTSESFVAVWKQQPENTAALNRYLEELKSRLASVRNTTTPPRDSNEPNGHTKKNSTGQGRVEAAAGPIKSSSKPSSEKETQDRIKATSLFRSAGPRPAAPSLAGVPIDRIRATCESADAQMADLAKLLRSVPADPAAINKSINQLSEILHDFHDPTEVPEPTTPAPKATVKKKA